MNKLLTTMKIENIIPYDNNPRKNEVAVEDVMESIKQCGYASPIVIDENNVILAGHTRWKALWRLGWTEVEVLQIEGMTEEQKKKFRLLDNKTGEKADWDIDLLTIELDGLDFEGFDFGFDDIKIEIEEPNVDPNSNVKAKIVKCPHCGKEFEV